MSNRRNRPPNKWGCKPDGDVCVGHDMPLRCRHGCDYAKPHPHLDPPDMPPLSEPPDGRGRE